MSGVEETAAAVPARSKRGPLPGLRAARTHAAKSKSRGTRRAPRPSRSQVVSKLDPVAVIQWCAVPGHWSHDEFRTRECPQCGQRDKEAVAVNRETGVWYCHAHGCTGDVLALLGGYEGYTDDADYPKLVGLAVDIIEGSAPREYRLARERRSSQRYATDLQAATERATLKWDSLQVDSDIGREYLASRGVADVVAVGAVRFTANGDPAVALYDIEPGARIVNVMTRRRALLGDAPKVLGLDACPTLGTLVGRIDDVTSESFVVVVEGVFDALTARLAWPDAAVLGAHNWSTVGRVVEAAARRSPARLLVVPHDDQSGAKAMADAQARVAALGFSFETVQVGSKDLNDAWRTGWRPAL